MEFFSGVLVGIAAWPFFWLIFAILATLLSVVVVKERGVLSSIFSLGVIVMLASKWQAILANPFPLIAGVGGYLVLGLLWSRFKWSRYLSESFNKFFAARDRFLKEEGIDKEKLKTLVDGDLDDYITKVRKYSGNIWAGEGGSKSVAAFHASLAPKAVTNKASIVMWIAYWPVTVVWYFCADFLADIGKALYNMVGSHFQKMSNEKFSGL